MKKVFAAIACCAGFSHADEWVLAGGSEGYVSEVKVGSVALSRTSAGEPIVSGLFRQKYDGKVEFFRQFVRLSHCDAGMGQIVYETVTGRIVGANDYVAEGGSVASAIGDLLCSSVKYLPRTPPASSPKPAASTF